MKKLTAAAAVLLLLLLLIPSSFAEGESDTEPQMAVYLEYPAPYPIYSVTQQEEFAAVCGAMADVSLAVRDYYNFIYSSSAAEVAGNFLLSCADAGDLLDCRTFLDGAGLSEQLSFLTETNGFKSFPLSSCGQLGGTEHDIEPGDVIFWHDSNGELVNAGVVTRSGNKMMFVSVRGGSGTAVLHLNEKTISSASLGSATVVSVQYPCRETLAYIYCRYTMGYNNAACCGILCNLYAESEFNPTREETANKVGYGICQWSFDRRQDLMAWCGEQGLDYTKMLPQLRFMQYELEQDEYIDLRYFLIGLYESEADACDATTNFCALFEQPGDTLNTAYSRASLTSQYYWPQYGGGANYSGEYFSSEQLQEALGDTPQE